MKRAAIYARVSVPRLQDTEEKVSIDLQVADCEEYCRAKGYTVVARYIDNAPYRSKGRLVDPSGTRSDRPQYLAMLEAARRGEFDVIVAWKEDRLCRGIYAAVPLGRVLEETKVTVELVKETFDPGMFFIKAAIGKLEVDNIRERMMMGKRGRLEKGRAWDPHKRYGYTLDAEGHLIIDPERAPWVRQVFAWYREGVAVREIRRRLIAQGAPPPDRKSGPKGRKDPWPLSTIHHILTCPDYWRGYTEARAGGKVIQIACPPIVDRETFEAVQALRKENRSHAGALVKHDYLCLGLVTCADGRKWAARSTRWKRKGVLRKTPIGTYYCPGQEQAPEAYHDPDCPRTVGAKKLDEAVWAQVSRLLENPRLVRIALEEELERLRAQEEEVKRDLERLAKELDRLATERQWVIAQARKGNISESDMVTQLQEIELQSRALAKEHEEKQALAALRQRAEELTAFAEEYLTDVAAGLAWLNQDLSQADEGTRREVFEAKREIVRTLVDKVIMHKGREVEIRFAIELPPQVLSLSDGSPQTQRLFPTALFFRRLFSEVLRPCGPGPRGYPPGPSGR